MASFLAGALMGLGVSGASPAMADEASGPMQLPTDAGLGIELNKLEQQPQSCRFYLVFRNQAEVTFDTLKLDLYLFDQKGLIQRRLAINAAPIDAGRTMVKVFGIAGLQCASVGQVLINDIPACQSADRPIAQCLQHVSPSSRVDTQLLK